MNSTTKRLIQFAILFCLFIVSAPVSASETISEIRIIGNFMFTEATLRNLIKTYPGNNLDSLQLDLDRQTIDQKYFEAGFLEAECKLKIKYRQNSGYRVTFVIAEGRPYYFGTITVAGNELVKSKFILKISALKPGLQFSRERIVKAQLKTISSNLFKDVEIKATGVENEQRTISVKIQVKEKKRHQINIGTGLDSEDGLKAFFEWKNRNFDGNGRGVYVSILNSVDYIESLYYKKGRFSAGYTNPFFFNSPVEWKVNFIFSTDKPKFVNFGIENYILESSLKYPLSFVDRITFRARAEIDRIYNATFQTEIKKFKNLFSVDNNRFIGINYERDTRDDLIDPSKGFLFITSVEKAGGFLGGGNSFYKLNLNLQNYYNLVSFIVIANKLTLGSIETANPEDIPSYQRFFLGGGGSLRGYAERSIGPKNPDGSSQGGNFLFSNSFEQRFYIGQYVNLITFLDFGNNWLKRDFANWASLYFTTGTGIRLRTTFGIFRFDYGIQLDKLPNKLRGNFHFGFGQSF